MTTPKEREVKLALPVAALRKFRKLPLVRAIKQRPKHDTQVSVYFDTDKQKLRRHGLMLRVRRNGQNYVQTIKATANADIFARDEWESEIEGKQPDLSLAHGTALGPLLTRKLRRRLKPSFETRVRRTIYPLARNGYEIALTLDRGTIDTGDASMPLCEIELELERGDGADLFDIARQITRALPAQLDLRSKADRGYSLLNGEAGQSVKFTATPLDAGTRAGDALRSIGLACLRQITGNEQALLKGDPEGVHQMRVGVRRLRAAISLFAALLNDPQSKKIKVDLKWLTEELGPARELEVLVKRVVRPVTASKSQWEGVPKLSQQLVQRRSAAVARAQGAVESERFRLLTLEIAAWLEIGRWVEAKADLVRDRSATPIETFAAEQFSRRSRKIRNKSKSFAELDARHRHKLRIQAKKLRYAADFFGEVFSGKQPEKRREKFLAALEQVQSCLGDLNDIVVHEKIISAAGIKRRKTSRKKAFAAGLLTGREDARLDPVMAAAEKALKKFARTKPFWPH
jgi:inorganic triphosphatase YgiF